MIKNKRGFEFSFAWIFAMLIGAAVLFLAIFATVKIIVTEEDIVGTIIAAELGVLLTPIETGLEEAKNPGAPIRVRKETRIFNTCREKEGGIFGKQGISSSTQTFGDEFSKRGREIKFSNKYIFSSDVEEGKEFYVFSKPFRMPYKVADLVYLWSEDYCFVSAPKDIREEIEDLDLGKVNSSSNIEGCSDKSVKVCFGFFDVECDMEVTGNKVIREEGEVFVDSTYDNSLVYGAIFASPKIYECQFVRLMGRASELAKVYAGKNEILSCSGTLGGHLGSYSSATAEVLGSQDIINNNLINMAKQIGGINDALACKIF